MNSPQQLSIKDYPFEKSDWTFYFKNFYKDRGLKVIYQFLNRPHHRPFSRKLIKKFSTKGYGLEIGCGARSICPANRTIFSDAFPVHGIHHSIAKVFFKGDQIPYPSDTFDFILSEHVLEHVTNPIKFLKEWIRVLAPQGHIIIFLPHRDRTNDRFRELTSLEHLIEDYHHHISENSDFHFNDWFENVVKRDLLPKHYAHLNKEELLNTGSIHHHVWTEKKIEELFIYLNLKICYINSIVPDRRDSFVVVAQKTIS